MCLSLMKLGFSVTDIHTLSLTMALNFITEHNEMMTANEQESSGVREATQADIQRMLA